MGWEQESGRVTPSDNAEPLTLYPVSRLLYQAEQALTIDFNSESIIGPIHYFPIFPNAGDSTMSNNDVLASVSTSFAFLAREADRENSSLTGAEQYLQDAVTE
jgi:hypothetical protein